MAGEDDNGLGGNGDPQVQLRIISKDNRVVLQFNPSPSHLFLSPVDAVRIARELLTAALETVEKPSKLWTPQ